MKATTTISGLCLEPSYYDSQTMKTKAIALPPPPPCVAQGRREWGLCFRGSYSVFGICRQPSCCCYYWLRSMGPVNEMFISLIIAHRRAAHSKLPVHWERPSSSSIDIPMDCKSVESRTSWTTPPIAAGGRASPTAKLAIVTLRRMHRHTEEGAIQKAIGVQGNRRTRNFPLLFPASPICSSGVGQTVDRHWKHPLFTPVSNRRVGNSLQLALKIDGFEMTGGKQNGK